MSGHVSNMFAVGVINSVTRRMINASPIFVGLLTDPQNEFVARNYRDGWIPAERIDNFRRCAREELPRRRDLEVLKKIPEKSIKRAFAELLREGRVPKDWAGETSDLFTDKVRINRKRVTAAFLLKGPAKFHEMRLPDLGAQGNQIDRLFREPAQLLVLQHCHYVHTDVRNMMVAYANQVGNMRQFAIIDGAETLRILRAYKKCGQRPHRFKK